MNRRAFLSTLPALIATPAIHVPAVGFSAFQPSTGHITAQEASELIMERIAPFVRVEHASPARMGQCALGLESRHPDELHLASVRKIADHLAESLKRLGANGWCRLLIPHGVIRSSYVGAVRTTQAHEVMYDRVITRFDVAALANGTPVGTGQALEIVRVWDDFN